jgi:peroxin-11B
MPPGRQPECFRALVAVTVHHASGSSLDFNHSANFQSFMSAIIRVDNGGTMSARNPWINTLNKLMATTDGRDKVVRMVQFGMRFLTWYLPVCGQDPAWALHIEAYVLDARRLFRLLKEFDSFEKISNLLASPAEGRQTLKFLSFIQQIGLCGLYLSNHALLAAKLRVLRYDHSVFRTIFGYCFSIALLAGLLQDLARLYLLSKLRQAITARPHTIKQPSLTNSGTNPDAPAHTAADLARLSAFRLEITVNLLRNLLDQAVAINVVRGATLHKGAVGAAGVATSLIQVRQRPPHSNAFGRHAAAYCTMRGCRHLATATSFSATCAAIFINSVAYDATLMIAIDVSMVEECTRLKTPG